MREQINLKPLRQHFVVSKDLTNLDKFTRQTKTSEQYNCSQILRLFGIVDKNTTHLVFSELQSLPFCYARVTQNLPLTLLEKNELKTCYIVNHLN